MTILLGGQLDSIGRGAHDDGDEGVVRTKLAQGSFSLAPAVDWFNLYTTEGTANAINPHGPGARAAGEGNPTRVSSAFYLNLAAGVTGKQAALVIPFRGKVIGVLYRNAVGTISATMPPTFAASVDGEIFTITQPMVRFHNLTQGGGTPKIETSTLALIADDLPDRQHTLKLIWTGESAASTRHLVYGFVVDGRYYPAATPSLTFLDPVAVPVSPTAAIAVPLTPAIPASGVTTLVTATTDRNLRYVRQLRFTNAGGAASSVNISKEANVIDAVPVVANAGSAGIAAAIWDPGEKVAMDPSYTLQVPAAGSASIKVITVGGW